MTRTVQKQDLSKGAHRRNSMQDSFSRAEQTRAEQRKSTAPAPWQLKPSICRVIPLSFQIRTAFAGYGEATARIQLYTAFEQTDHD
jgi:hypothetical protein